MDRNPNNFLLLLCLGGLLVLTVLGLVCSQYLLILSAAVFIIVVLFGWLFGLRKQLMLLLSFLIPLSVELPLTDNAMIIYPTEPIIGALFFLLVFDLVRKEIDFGSELKSVLWTIPFVSAFLISTPFSEMLGVSLKFSLVNLAYYSVFFFYLNYHFKQDLGFFKQLITVYSISLGLVSLWAFFTYYGYGWNPVVVRGIFVPFFRDNTIFGASVGFLTAYWLVGAFISNGFSAKWKSGVAGVFFLAMVFVSASRAAWLSIVFAAIVYLIMALRIKFRFVALGTVILAAVLYFGYGKLVQNIGSIDLQSSHGKTSFWERAGSVANFSTDVSNVERVNRWHASVTMFSQKPLVGFGPGTYQFVYIPFQNEQLRNRLTVTDPANVPDNSGGTAHSEYLLALSEMGLFGLLAWLALIIKLFFVVFFKKMNATQRKYLMVGVVTVSTYFFHAFFNNFLGIEKIAFLFWASLAFVNVNSNQKYERNIL